ncbi:hypothetical protein GOBAR_DD08973 [Gossypium barbadense]|nr:hypothetical protein GOBAR_DD08973 [Gossypium barbadense]
MNSADFSVMGFDFISELKGIEERKLNLAGNGGPRTEERRTSVSVFFDAAFDQQHARSASGLIVRGEGGEILASKSVIHTNIATPFAAEAHAGLQALELGRSLKEGRRTLPGWGGSEYRPSSSGEGASKISKLREKRHNRSLKEGRRTLPGWGGSEYRPSSSGEGASKISKLREKRRLLKGEAEGLQGKRFMLFQFGKYPLETTQSQIPIFETGWNYKENDSCNQPFEVSLPVSVSFLFLLQVDVETAMGCKVSLSWWRRYHDLTGSPDEAEMVGKEMSKRATRNEWGLNQIGRFTMRNKEELFEFFEKMKQMGCQPTNDTYIMMIEIIVNGATLIMSSGQKMVDFKSNQLHNNQLDNQIRVETK